MQVRNSRIGISGGTFDPVHYGHLIIAETIREKFSLDKVLFVPTGNPPHKVGSRVTEPRHRFNMVSAATKSNPWFEISDIEIGRKGFVYTVDTMSRLKEEYGGDTRFFFISGADVVWDLLKWKDIERLFTLCEFVIASRPGFKKEKLHEKIEELKLLHGARISVTDTTAVDISSTLIREKVGGGRSIKYLVPEAVEEYIHEHGLYR